MEKITPLEKKITLPPAVTAVTNLTSQTDGKRFFCCLHGPTKNGSNEEWCLGSSWGNFYGWVSKFPNVCNLLICFLKKVQYLEESWGKGWGHKVDVRGKVEWSLGALLEDVGACGGTSWDMWGHQLMLSSASPLVRRDILEKQSSRLDARLSLDVDTFIVIQRQVSL